MNHAIVTSEDIGGNETPMNCKLIKCLARKKTIALKIL